MGPEKRCLHGGRKRNGRQTERKGKRMIQRNKSKKGTSHTDNAITREGLCPVNPGKGGDRSEVRRLVKEGFVVRTSLRLTCRILEGKQGFLTRVVGPLWDFREERDRGQEERLEEGWGYRGTRVMCVGSSNIRDPCGTQRWGLRKWSSKEGILQRRVKRRIGLVVKEIH